MEEETKLIKAVRDGDTSVIIKLLENQKNDINKQDNGWSPLLVATYKLDLALVKLLLAANADPNGQNRFLVTPLMVAALMFSVNTTNNALEMDKTEAYLGNCGADVRVDSTTLSEDYKTAKTILAKNRCTSAAIAEQLLLYKANPDALNSRGESAIFGAARIGNTKMVKTLVQQKANPNIVTNDGTTLLLLAVKHSRIGILSTLLQEASVIENAAHCDTSGRSVLHFAVETGETNTLAKLLKCIPTIPDIIDNAGNTALILAIKLKKIEAAKILITSKANINLPDKYGYTPLALAQQNQLTPIINLLIMRATADAIYAKAAWQPSGQVPNLATNPFAAIPGWHPGLNSCNTGGFMGGAPFCCPQGNFSNCQQTGHSAIDEEKQQPRTALASRPQLLTNHQTGHTAFPELPGFGAGLSVPPPSVQYHVDEEQLAQQIQEIKDPISSPQNYQKQQKRTVLGFWDIGRSENFCKATPLNSKSLSNTGNSGSAFKVSTNSCFKRIKKDV